VSRPARDRAAQQPPPTTLAGFPTLVRPRRRLWRAGRSVHANPWWFDGSGAGRFDPIGTGQASCYLGTDRIAGLLKVLDPEMSGGAVHVDDLTAPSNGPRPRWGQVSGACVTAAASIPAPVPAASPCSDRPASTPGAGQYHHSRGDVAPPTGAGLLNHHHRHPTTERAARRATTLNEPLSAAIRIALP